MEFSNDEIEKLKNMPAIKNRRKYNNLKVMTDGTVTIGENGFEKELSIKSGYGNNIEMWKFLKFDEIPSSNGRRIIRENGLIKEQEVEFLDTGKIKVKSERKYYDLGEPCLKAYYGADEGVNDKADFIIKTYKKVDKGLEFVKKVQRSILTKNWFKKELLELEKQIRPKEESENKEQSSDEFKMNSRKEYLESIKSYKTTQEAEQKNKSIKREDDEGR